MFVSGFRRVKVLSDSPLSGAQRAPAICGRHQVGAVGCSRLFCPTLKLPYVVGTDHTMRGRFCRGPGRMEEQGGSNEFSSEVKRLAAVSVLVR